MWRFILVLAAIFSVWFFVPRNKYLAYEEFPLREEKPFVLFVYAVNGEQTVQRTLQSIFEQDYTNFRVVFIDDASHDRTYKKAKEFIFENNLGERVSLVRNEHRLGEKATLYRNIELCKDREIVLVLHAQDFLSTTNALQKLNAAYHNPSVWASVAPSLDYPSYEISQEKSRSWYAAVFKELELKEISDASLEKKAKGHVVQLSFPYAFARKI